MIGEQAKANRKKKQQNKYITVPLMYKCQLYFAINQNSKS